MYFCLVDCFSLLEKTYSMYPFHLCSTVSYSAIITPTLNFIHRSKENILSPTISLIFLGPTCYICHMQILTCLCKYTIKPLFFCSQIFLMLTFNIRNSVPFLDGIFCFSYIIVRLSISSCFSFMRFTTILHMSER